MRLLIAVILLGLFSGTGLAGRLGGSTAGSLEFPVYNVIGKTAASRLHGIKPRTVIEPAGMLGAADEPAERDLLLLERRLDCFASATLPDRDSRNRFLARCPGNNW